MKNMHPPFPGADYNEYIARKVDAKHYIPSNDSSHMMLNTLLEAGFVWEEAVTLLNLREHLYENIEMRQRMESDHRMHFVRWLYQHGEMSES